MDAPEEISRHEIVIQWKIKILRRIINWYFFAKVGLSTRFSAVTPQNHYNEIYNKHI